MLNGGHHEASVVPYQRYSFTILNTLPVFEIRST